jgi:hypothetical protein
MGTPAHLFVWRTTSDRSGSTRRFCPICRTVPSNSSGTHQFVGLNTSFWRGQRCPLCGWRLEISENYRGTSRGEEQSTSGFESVLRKFDLNAPEVGLNELGGWLKRNLSDVYSLSPRRFEELTADVFNAHGYRVALTQSTRDGGADILLLQHDSDTLAAIVECKRYARRRRVGVSLVRTLVGAAVAWDVRRAYLVTTSGFSPDAQHLVDDYERYGYDIDLVGFSDLASLLGVYNPDLPRLDHLTSRMRAEIIAANRETD